MDGVWAKFDQAVRHADAFDALFTGYCERDSYSVTHHFDSETGWNHFRWNVHEEPPRTELALLFGDMLYNLRGSLDYLAWQLVCVNGGAPTKYTAFPVAKSPDVWASDNTKRRIEGIAVPWVALIDDLQPYHRPDPETDMLSILDDVNNINKHRFVPPTITTVVVWRALINVQNLADGEQLEHFLNQTMSDQADLFRIRAASKVKLDVDMDPKPPLRVAFSGGPEIDWTNRDLIEWVRGVLTRFEPAFPG